MAEPYICASDLRDMGHQSRIDRVNTRYEIVKAKMIDKSQNGDLFIDIQICGHDWSIVDDLCEKIRAEHPGVVVKNERNYIPGCQSSILVRWD